MINFYTYDPSQQKQKQTKHKGTGLKVLVSVKHTNIFNNLDKYILQFNCNTQRDRPHSFGECRTCIEASQTPAMLFCFRCISPTNTRSCWKKSKLVQAAGISVRWVKCPQNQRENFFMWCKKKVEKMFQVMSKKDSHYYSGPPFDAISQVGQMQVVGKPLKQLDQVFNVLCLCLYVYVCV